MEITNGKLLDIMNAIEAVLEWDYSNLISDEQDGCHFYHDLEKLRKLYEGENNGH